MLIAYDPDDEDWSPSAWLGAYTAGLYDEFAEYWQLNAPADDSDLTERQRADLHHLKAMADAMTDCLHSLTASNALVGKTKDWFTELGIDRRVDERVSAAVARAIHNHAIVRDAIKLDLASQAADILLAGAEKRAAFLIALISDRRLSDRAAAFLDRATRLYLWGFSPEAVVMCASVLEAAYEVRFTAHEMFRLQITKSGKEYEPYEYEQGALAAGVFTKPEKDLARQIRSARNDTLHNAPNTALDAEDALTITADLLEKLLARE